MKTYYFGGFTMKNIEKTVEDFKKEFNLKKIPDAYELKGIIRSMNYQLLTYESNKELLEILKLTDKSKYYPSMSCSQGSKNYTFYRGTVSEQDLPFILTHEVGHIYMNHSKTNKGFHDTSDYKDEEANIFATYLLYPPKPKKNKLSTAITSSLLIIQLVIILALASCSILNHVPEENQISVQAQPLTETSSTYSNQPTYKLEQSNSGRISTPEVNNVAQAPTVSEESNSSQPSTEQPPAEQPITVISDSSASVETVYVTTSGEKYHKPNCQYVKYKTNLTAYTISVAQEKRYVPCARCFK